MFERFLKFIQGPAGNNTVMSPLDTFLHEFESKRKTVSISRQQEKAKADRIAYLRDNPVNPNQQ